MIFSKILKYIISTLNIMKAVSELTNLHWKETQAPRAVISSFKFICQTQENLVIILLVIYDTAWIYLFSLGSLSIVSLQNTCVRNSSTRYRFKLFCLSKISLGVSTGKGILYIFLNTEFWTVSKLEAKVVIKYSSLELTMKITSGHLS